MSADSETIALYDARVGDYRRLVSSEVPNPKLERFIDAVITAEGAGARVLDLGCGPGNAAARMAARGLDVDAVDASGEMVRTARQVYGIAARQAQFSDIVGKRIYAGVWASFSLLHAPRSAFSGHLAALHLALVAGGLFHIGMKTGNGENRDSIGRFYTYYTEAELNRLVEEAGFSVTHQTLGEDVGLDGTLAPWIILSAHA
ncbi:MAG: class I SAM-dependent methyltransferase [Halocynthiibacter sp.]